MGHLSLVKRHGCTTWHGQLNMINEPLINYFNFWQLIIWK